MRNIADHKRFLDERLAEATSVHGTNMPSVLSAHFAFVCRRLTHETATLFLVGGTIRELALRDRSQNFRDIDLMVQGCTGDTLQRCYHDVITERTSLGGYRIRHLFPQNRMTVDLWRLEDTWAFADSDRERTIDDFLKTPFLNLDSIAAEWIREEARWIVHENGFWSGVAARTLDINYEPNPNPILCSIRSIYLSKRLSFRLSDRLAKYVFRSLSKVPHEAVDLIQKAHFGRSVMKAPAITAALLNIKTQLAT